MMQKHTALVKPPLYQPTATSITAITTATISIPSFHFIYSAAIANSSRITSSLFNWLFLLLLLFFSFTSGKNPKSGVWCCEYRPAMKSRELAEVASKVATKVKFQDRFSTSFTFRVSSPVLNNNIITSVISCHFVSFVADSGCLSSTVPLPARRSAFLLSSPK